MIDKIDFEINWNHDKISPKNQFIFEYKKSNKSIYFHMEKTQQNQYSSPSPKSWHANFLALRTRCLLDFASYMAIYIYQGTRHFFKAFLFQGFPFSRLSFSMFSFFKGMSMLLGRQLLQSSFSRTFGFFFKKSPLQIKSQAFSGSIFFKTVPVQPFSRWCGDGFRQRKDDPFSRVNVFGCQVHPFSGEQEVKQHTVLRCYFSTNLGGADSWTHRRGQHWDFTDVVFWWKCPMCLGV